MVDDAQTHLLPRGPDALDNVAQLHGLADGAELLDLLRPHVERAGAIFDSLAPDERGSLSNDPDILRGELARARASPTPKRRRGTSRDWRSGKARSLRSPAAQQAFEAMLPGLLQAIAAGADPDHALNRLSDIVERLSSGVNFFRLLEARPPLARAARQDPRPRAGARRPARRGGRSCSKACSTRRASQCRRRRRSSPQLLADAMRGQPYDVALDRVRRLVNERRFALGVQLIDRRRDPLEVTEGYARVAEGALIALGGAAAERSSRQRTAGSRTAS